MHSKLRGVYTPVDTDNVWASSEEEGLWLSQAARDMVGLGALQNLSPPPPSAVVAVRSPVAFCSETA